MDARQASGAEDDGRQGVHDLADRVWPGCFSKVVRFSKVVIVVFRP